MKQKTLLTVVLGASLTIVIVGAIGCVSMSAPWCSLFSLEQGAQEDPYDTSRTNASISGQPADPAKEIDGKITDISPSGKNVTIRDKNNREFSIVLTGETKFFDENNNPTDLSSFRKGFVVRSEGKFTSDYSLTAAKVKVISLPAISVFSPQPDSEVGLPLVVKGEARVFENVVSYRLRDEGGAILTEGNTVATALDVGHYGPFEVSLSYPEPKGKRGVVEVFAVSPKDGSEINKVTVPVRFREVEGTNVDVYFGNREKDPEGLACEKTYPAERRVPQTSISVRAALEELLKGTTGPEVQAGFFTTINPGVKIKSLTVEGGTARIDFDGTLQANVGGACRVAAIRSQIENTVKQFPNIKIVRLSIDGSVEDILQP